MQCGRPVSDARRPRPRMHRPQRPPRRPADSSGARCARQRTCPAARSARCAGRSWAPVRLRRASGGGWSQRLGAPSAAGRGLAGPGGRGLPRRRLHQDPCTTTCLGERTAWRSPASCSASSGSTGSGRYSRSSSATSRSARSSSGMKTAGAWRSQDSSSATSAWQDWSSSSSQWRPQSIRLSPASREPCLRRPATPRPAARTCISAAGDGPRCGRLVPGRRRRRVPKGACGDAHRSGLPADRAGR